MAKRWLQIRGDPSIRQFLFSQSRVANEFDEHLGEVIRTVNLLLRERGFFHAKIHFSSGQVTLWSIADPYNYQVFLKEEFLAPRFLWNFDVRPYPINANVPPQKVRQVLDIFTALRNKDDSIYLRSGSINIINGMVGLNFSCDGSHYIDHQEFIDHREDVYG